MCRRITSCSFCVLDEKRVWDLPANLAQEVSSVEELLSRGGCDSANSRLIVQVIPPRTKGIGVLLTLFFFFSLVFPPAVLPSELGSGTTATTQPQ